MALSLPYASVEVQDGGLGLSQSSPTNVHVIIGTSSKGPLVTDPDVEILTFSKFNQSVATFGCGLMPKAAAYAVRRTRARHICVRVPAVATAASVSTITKPAGKTVTTTGTPLLGVDVVFEFVVGGTVGTTGMSYRYSLNGGVTYTATAPLGTATTVVIGNSGVTLTLTAPDTYTAGQEIRFWTKPASASIGLETVTRADASTATIDASGTPHDEYDLSFEILTGGTVGTVGITYRVSLDGGYSYGPETQLGTANSVTIMDGSEASGLTLALGAGTLDAGDKFTTTTTAPTWQASDIQVALNALKAANIRYRFVHVVGECTATKAGDIQSVLSTLEGEQLFTYAVVSARDHIAGEVDSLGKPSSFFSARLKSDFQNLVANRVSVAAGRARILCPVTGRKNRRPVSWPAVARLVESEVHFDLGRVKSGALPSDVSLTNAAGKLVELDSRIDDILHGERFLTVRSFARRAGVYMTRGSMMAQTGSQFSRISMRAVMDIASEVAHAVAEEQLENHMVANPLTGPQPDDGSVPGQDPVPGALGEADARTFDNDLRSALQLALVSRGYAVAIGEVRVSRETPFLTTGELEVEVEIVPYGYVESVRVRIGFQG